MLGAIAGDMIGVPWESMGEKRYDFLDRFWTRP
jgi:ADP-ribosylglycohydrolase